MKRKNMMTALVCAVCIAAAPTAAIAQETEAVTEAASELETGLEETEAESEEEVLVRPEYRALDYVTLGEYMGLKVQVAPVSVSDEDVEEEAKSSLQLYGDDVYETITEGQVQNGDTANIDYEGKLDGEAFDGGTSKGYDLKIGSGTFIDGFEDGLIDVEIGTTVDLPLTFPESYHSEELAGKEVVFTVTVNEVKRMKELTDELVNEVTDGEFADLAAYKENVRATLEANAEEERQNSIKTELLSLIAASSEITEYPQELVDYSVADMTNYYESFAEMYGMEFADFLEAYFGMTEEEYAEESVNAVKQNLQQELYVKAIAEAEGLEVDEEAYAAGCQKYMEDYGFESEEALVEAIGGEATLRLSILLDNTYDYLVENAVIEEIAEESESVTE